MNPKLPGTIFTAADEIRAAGGIALPIQCDIRDEEQIAHAVAEAAALSLGVSLLMSALTAKYRDLTHLSGLIIQVWMYATPVIIPLSEFPRKWQWLVVLNPMTSIVESIRLMLLGNGTVHPSHLIYSASFTLLSLAAGLLLFGKVEKTFVDTV